MSKNPKNQWKLMKKANIDREFLHIFWTTCGNSMKFSGKMCFKIILKVTKNQGFTLSLEDTFFGKPQGGSNWPPFLSRFRVNNGGFITDKELKYFSFDHKRVCNLGKLYFLPKVHERLFNVPGRQVISNCGTPHRKESEFLDSHLKTILQVSWSYIKDPAESINKTDQIGDIPENPILVTADIVGLYPSIPNKAGLQALKNTLEKRGQKHIHTEKLINMAEFVLKINFFEFNGSVKQQVSGTVIGTKCAPTYACIYMDEVLLLLFLYLKLTKKKIMYIYK